MNLIVHISLLCVGTIAIPIDRAIQNPASRLIPFGSLSHGSTTFASTESSPTRRYLQTNMGTIPLKMDSEIVINRDDYEHLVALCEAGFVSYCEAAIKKTE